MPGNFSHVIKTFLDSPYFKGLGESTKDHWKRELVLAEVTLGEFDVAELRPSIIQAHLDGLATYPGKQSTAKTAIKALESWAIVRDFLPHTITLGTKVIGSDGGHEPWTDQEVADAIEHARPDLGRAVLLAVSTGQRGSDIVKMRWSDIEEKGGRFGVNVIQRKTGVRLLVPFTHEFSAKVQKWERRPPFFLVLAPDGRQFSRSRLSHDWTYEREENALLASHKLRGLVLHGLRSTACVRLNSQGATTLEISSMTGMSEPMVARYCRLANKNRLAMQAMDRIDNVRTLQTNLLKSNDPTL